MQSKEPPFLFYRNEVYFDFRGGKGPIQDSRLDSSFYDGLKNAWSEVHVDFRNATSENSRESARAGMFLCGIGLLTFGHLDVIDDILDWASGTRANVRKLAYAIKELIPLPAGLDPLKDPAGTKAWIKSNEQNLVWDDKQGIFKLQSGMRSNDD